MSFLVTASGPGGADEPSPQWTLTELTAAAFDLDSDGFPDIFEAVDGEQNFLFRNLGDETFEETAEAAGVAFDRTGAPMASMHPSTGDVDGDGRIDLFVPDLRFGCFCRNRGGFLLQDATRASGLALSTAGNEWGSGIADFDNDGDLELLVALGSHLARRDVSRGWPCKTSTMLATWTSSSIPRTWRGLPSWSAMTSIPGGTG